MTSLLLVDDDKDAVATLARALSKKLDIQQLEVVHDHQRAVDVQSRIFPDVAVVDLHLTSEGGVNSGFQLIEQLLANDSTIRIIVLTGHSGSEHGIRAIEQGASHFLEKPAEITHLAALIKDATYQSQLRKELRDRKTEGEDDSLEHLIVGKSVAVQEIRKMVRYAASNPLPVFLRGETGTGKGSCALAIHRLSQRAKFPFVRYQPQFASVDLVGSELFGHEKGAFTGADEKKSGLLKEADRGSFFLDEVDELPSDTQVALLGALQEKMFRPLGSKSMQSSDFRLISASNAEIEQAIEQGKFRRDLFHRLSHIQITLPALRERKEDIELLAEKILQSLQQRSGLLVHSFTSEAYGVLSDYDWPGNIRELEGVVESACYLAQFENSRKVERSHLSVAGAQIKRVNDTESGGYHQKVKNYKLSLVQEALAQNHGNQVQAARSLGIDRTSLRRILAIDSPGE